MLHFDHQYCVTFHHTAASFIGTQHVIYHTDRHTAQQTHTVACKHALVYQAPTIHRHCRNVYQAPTIHRHCRNVYQAPTIHRHCRNVYQAPTLHRHCRNVYQASTLHRHSRNVYQTGQGDRVSQEVESVRGRRQREPGGGVS